MHSLMRHKVARYNEELLVRVDARAVRGIKEKACIGKPATV